MYITRACFKVLKDNLSSLNYPDIVNLVESRNVRNLLK